MTLEQIEEDIAICVKYILIGEFARIAEEWLKELQKAREQKLKEMKDEKSRHPD